MAKRAVNKGDLPCARERSAHQRAPTLHARLDMRRLRRWMDYYKPHVFERLLKVNSDYKHRKKRMYDDNN